MTITETGGLMLKINLDSMKHVYSAINHILVK